MKKIIFALAITFLFVGCSKDQIVVNEINGNWTTVASTLNGTNDLVAGDTWSFNKCEIAQGSCSGTYSVPTFIGTIVTAFTYNVYAEGTKFSIDFSTTYNDIGTINIMERTTSRMKVNYTDSNGYHEKTLDKK